MVGDAVGGGGADVYDGEAEGVVVGEDVVGEDVHGAQLLEARDVAPVDHVGYAGRYAVDDCRGDIGVAVAEYECVDVDY